ncbi:hypothetical protein F5Y16DRAFT_191379 [Xylariaceae sp. FL0255]|nr:hypothetical protein F5Y16DRAFT_191379 [Xylariaceae sp. FL0255]
MVITLLTLIATVVTHLCPSHRYPLSGQRNKSMGSRKQRLMRSISCLSVDSFAQLAVIMSLSRRDTSVNKDRIRHQSITIRTLRNQNQGLPKNQGMREELQPGHHMCTPEILYGLSCRRGFFQLFLGRRLRYSSVSNVGSLNPQLL